LKSAAFFLAPLSLLLGSRGEPSEQEHGIGKCGVDCGAERSGVEQTRRTGEHGREHRGGDYAEEPLDFTLLLTN
jgi:hypothetical protein